MKILLPQKPWICALLCVAPGALVATLYGWGTLLSTFVQPGWIGWDHIAPGTDWMVFYGAIKCALAGDYSLMMDGDRFTAFLNHSMADWLTRPLGFRPWLYPPSFLVFLLPFAPLGFLGSYLAFQLLGIMLLTAALRTRADRGAPWPYVALAVLMSPAASINITDGQCAFLVAALIIGGMRLLDRRPVLAGIVLGLLSFKPQFCLLVPVALIAAGQRRSLLAAGLSAFAAAVVSIAVFGPEIWSTWLSHALQNLVDPDVKWASYARIWGNSIWADLMALGVSPQLASAAQALGTIAGALATFLAFRSRLGGDRKLAVLLAATHLAAPHVSPYDAILLAAAATLWLAGSLEATRLWQWTLALGLWMVPVLSPPPFVPLGRFSFLLTIALLVAILDELRRSLARPRATAGDNAQAISGAVARGQA